MKTLNLLTVLFICLLSTGYSQSNPNQKKVVFGIYEIISPKDLPASFTEALKRTNIKFEKNIQSTTIGYIEKTDPMITKLDVSKQSFTLVKSYFTVDKEGKYVAVAAIKRHAVLENADIQSTEPKGNKVLIHFNLKGARKWAELTKNNIGKSVAFIIDHQIYTMPMINAEIRSGESMINGLESEAIAKSISETLNATLVK